MTTDTWGLDAIKKGIAGLSDDATDLYEKYDTEEERSREYKKIEKKIERETKKLENWSKTKEGQATIAVAEEIGFTVIGAVAGAVIGAGVGGAVGATAGASLARVRAIYRNKDTLVKLGSEYATLGKKADKLEVLGDKLLKKSDDLSSSVWTKADKLANKKLGTAKVAQIDKHYEGIPKNQLPLLGGEGALEQGASKKVAKLIDKRDDLVDRFFSLEYSKKKALVKVDTLYAKIDDSLDKVYVKMDLNSKTYSQVQAVIKQAASKAERVAREVGENLGAIFGVFTGMTLGEKKAEERADMRSLEGLSDEELKAKGYIRVPGFTKKNGTKVKSHIRKLR